MYFRKFLEANGFWGNVGAGVLPFCGSTDRFLVQLRSYSVLEPGTWGIWGGKVDDEDAMNIEQEVKRELMEEAGYNGPIKLIPAHVFKHPSGFVYHNFIGVVYNEFMPNNNHAPEEFKHSGEWDDFRWLTYEELLRLPKKHFGLAELLKNSKELFENLVKENYNEKI